eukprot:6173222-Pleurochrysis_carterae.AAC.7
MGIGTLDQDAGGWTADGIASARPQYNAVPSRQRHQQRRARGELAGKGRRHAAAARREGALFTTLGCSGVLNWNQAALPIYIA